MPFVDGKWYEADDPIYLLMERVRKLNDQLIIYKRNQEYHMEVMGMKRAWQESQEDNLDATHPIVLDIYIPPDTKVIQRVKLRLRLKAFRAYSTGAAAGGDHRHKVFALNGADGLMNKDSGAAAKVSVPSVDSDFASHVHTYRGISLDRYLGYLAVNDPIASLTGTVYLTDTWSSAQLRDIYTYDSSGNHVHPIVYGIYEGTQASNVTIKINGVDRTAELGGPFNADQGKLDITKYLTPTEFNTIEIGSATLGRIHATFFVEIYLP